MEDNQIKPAMWAKQLLRDGNWCIIDTETTGLDNPQIIQIGVLTPTMPDGWQAYVKPAAPIEPGATRIHGITYDQVKDAPYFEYVFIDLLKMLGNRDIVIYNSNYDLKAIRNSMKARGIQLAFPTSDRRQCRIFTNGGSIHCAMEHYSEWCGDWNDYYSNYRWQKLPGGDHSALGDCKATLKVIQDMASTVIIPAPVEEIS